MIVDSVCATEMPPSESSRFNPFVTYIVVGMVNTVFGYSLFALFIFLGFHYSLAVLFSTLLGIMFNFKTIGKIVFKSSDNSLILRFVSVYFLTYVLNVAGMRILAIYQLNTYISGALLVMPIAVISFILHRGFVFRPAQKVTANAIY